MRAALVTEYRKLTTTRMWWILLLSMVVYMAFISGVMAWVLSQGDSMGPASGGQEVVLSPEAVVRTVYTIAVSLGYVFPVIVGVIAVTSEFRHQTITPTFLAEPRRSVVLGAKLVAGAALGLIFGVVGTASAVGAGAGVLTLVGEPTFLGEPATWRILGQSSLALAVWAVVGVGIGTLLTNQVAAIVVVLAFNQFLEPVLRMLLPLASWGEDVAKYLPGAAGEAISGGSFYAAMGMSGMLDWWQGLLVLLGYAVVFAAIGRRTTFRQDIT